MRLFKGMNTAEDVQTLDGDMFQFNGTKKSLFYYLLRLIKPMPNEWLANLQGNAAILRDLYFEYLEHEYEDWRRQNTTRAIPFLLRLLEDPNYEEVFTEWFLYRILQEKDRFRFNRSKIEPGLWFRDDLGENGMRLNIKIEIDGEESISGADI